jgi:putative ABC transport system substrate-binding protein
MRRRDFLGIVGGTAAAWPLAARTQQAGRRRIGLLVTLSADDPDQKARLAAFRQGLERRGWSEGHNVHIDYRFAVAGVHARALAKELVALQPDVIVAQSTPIAAAVQQESRTIPIVFVNVSDPIGSGFIANLARPGGNLTGLLLFEASVAGKWLAMLKEIAPDTVRVGVLGNPKTTPFDYFLKAMDEPARRLAIELVAHRIEDAGGFERAIESLARLQNAGLVLPPDATSIVHRDLVVALAARHRLPAVYGSRTLVAAGGLMSYDTDRVDMLRRAASYVDRILRGDKPADLPVQAPTKYETVVNLKTAKALGLTVPPGILVAADEVIE